MMRTIGLLGGTFDPFHNGHLQLAEAVLKSCGFERIIFIPAANPPHKDSTTICDISHRRSMIATLVQRTPRFEISDLELSKHRPSYTIDTLASLRRQYRANHYYVILGHDAFLEIETWHRWREIITSTHFVIVRRTGYPPEEIEHLLARNDFSRSGTEKELFRHDTTKVTIRLLAAHIADISSSDIRKRIGEGRGWQHLVPASVAAYIEAHHLYYRKKDW